MTDTSGWADAGYEDDQDTNLVKDLRKQLKEKADAEKAQAQRLAELEKLVRKSSINDVLTAKGVPTKLAAFVPGDVEATAEGVGKWLEEYGDVFNITAPEGQQSQGTAPVVGQDQQEAIQTMQDVSATAEPSKNGGPVTVADILNAETLEDLRALIARGG